MPAHHRTPTFNLKAVVQETGLKPDTLRAWERRYGLPNPERTGGGHRLYSLRDIDLLKWLIERQQEGLSISRAVEKWRQLEAEAQDPLEASNTSITEPAPTPVGEGEAIIELRTAWISACLDFDEQQAEQLLSQAFALYSPETVCIELLQKGLADIGQGWYRNEITAQQEHFASALAIRRLEALISTSPAPTRSGRLLVGCPPFEEHTFSPLLLTLLLRRQGWQVIYLGANVPVTHLGATVAAASPQLVIIAAQRLITAAMLLQMARLLQADRVPLAYGGLIFNTIPELRRHIPGHFLGERMDMVPERVHRLLSSPSLPTSAEEPAEALQETLAHYRARQAQIEADVWNSVKQKDILHTHLVQVNAYLADNIAAALTLGNMKFIGTDISWLEGLLINYRIPTEQLLWYLTTYARAAKQHLDEPGQPILDWLDQILFN